MVPTKEDVLSIFKSTGALLEGHFLLSSGLHSPNYFQCAKVLQYPKYLTMLCEPIAAHFANAQIQVVISPALGGVVVGTEVGRLLGVRTIFAERADGIMTLRRGFELQPTERCLIVEDVVTTGGSVREVMKIVEEHNAVVAGVGFIVDRSNGKVKLSDNQFSLLQMDVVAYQPDDLPPELARLPAIKPGSRPKPQLP
ncbi:MAG: orotate phosphoribosyltransferase [[Candidatus Thermochlorobacteriaceae] bacterium GBChlB]|nr:MAG: orotate phosphoribosyltransferase [[Candidatus Thermochlorobacteriaceae] bacterium GBChlB]